MSLLDILLTVLIQSLFCLGLRTLMSEGQLLYFIRKPFSYDEVHPVWCFLLKPIIICVICFSSFWGGAVYVVLHGFHLQDIQYLILACISTAFILKFVNDKVDW